MTLSTKQTIFFFRKVDVILFLMKVDSTSAKDDTGRSIALLKRNLHIRGFKKTRSL